LGPQGQFIPNWPPINENVEPEALPAMVRITLELDRGEDMTLFVPGPESYATARAGEDERDL